MNPLISLIIPTFNRADLLPETLDSIIAQTYQNWECVVVDDGSTDDTFEVLEKYAQKDSRFRVYQRPEELPKSGNSCRNYGFELSKGEFVNFFDSDDVMLPDFLESRILCINDKINMVFATYKTVDEDLKCITQKQFIRKENLLKDYIFWRFPVITHSVLFRKSFLVGKPLFDPSIRKGQETHFFLDAFDGVSEEEIAWVEQPTFLYRQHHASISSAGKNYNYNYSESLIKTRVKAFDKGLKYNDKELMFNSHLHLVMLLFQAIKPNDKRAVNAFKKCYLHNNSILTFAQKMEIKFMIPFLMMSKLASKKLEKRWINFLQ